MLIWGVGQLMVISDYITNFKYFCGLLPPLQCLGEAHSDSFPYFSEWCRSSTVLCNCFVGYLVDKKFCGLWCIVGWLRIWGGWIIKPSKWSSPLCCHCVPQTRTSFSLVLSRVDWRPRASGCLSTDAAVMDGVEGGWVWWWGTSGARWWLLQWVRLF